MLFNMYADTLSMPHTCLLTPYICVLSYFQCWVGIHSCIQSIVKGPFTLIYIFTLTPHTHVYWHPTHVLYMFLDIWWLVLCRYQLVHSKHCRGATCATRHLDVRHLRKWPLDNTSRYRLDIRSHPTPSHPTQLLSDTLHIFYMCFLIFDFRWWEGINCCIQSIVEEPFMLVNIYADKP